MNEKHRYMFFTIFGNVILAPHSSRKLFVDCVNCLMKKEKNVISREFDAFLEKENWMDL